jgi:hypothetical protein
MHPFEYFGVDYLCADEIIRHQILFLKLFHSLFKLTFQNVAERSPLEQICNLNQHHKTRWL